MSRSISIFRYSFDSLASFLTPQRISAFRSTDCLRWIVAKTEMVAKLFNKMTDKRLSVIVGSDQDFLLLNWSPLFAMSQHICNRFDVLLFNSYPLSVFLLLINDNYPIAKWCEFLIIRELYSNDMDLFYLPLTIFLYPGHYRAHICFKESLAVKIL